jgi:hypothetical protein
MSDEKKQDDKNWRDATGDDIARMMKGETVEARFRDHLQEDWSKAIWLLAGYDDTEEHWIDNTGCPWVYCQVPVDAGKSDLPKDFRLLGKEPRLASDGYWSLSCKDWLVIGDRVEIANRDKWPAIRFVVDEPEPVKHQSQDQASSFGSNPVEVRPIMQIRLPVPASVLGKLGDMLEKHYPGSTMRQVGGYLVFEEPSDA